MRKIGIPEIEDIATGAALLGAGGGGDPYVGKLVAIGAVQECGPVTLLDPEEVPDDALIVPIAMMGAPTVLAEKAIGGTEYKKLFDMVSKFFGQKIYAFMPIEAGGVNSMLPSPPEYAHGGCGRHGPRVPRAANGYLYHRRHKGHTHGAGGRKGQQLYF